MKYDVLCPFAFAKSRLHGVRFLCGNRADNVGGFECAGCRGHLGSLFFFFVFSSSLCFASLSLCCLYFFLLCAMFFSFSHFKRFVLLFPCKFIKH
jgi:hypothetical protein